MNDMEQESLQMYKFLVKLRDSGVTNMFGASEYLDRAFGLRRGEGTTVLVDWMKSFDLPEDQQPDDGRNVRR